MSVLIVAEHIRGELRPITLELVTAARSLEGPVALAVIAKDPSALADQVTVDGVDEILSVNVEQEEFENDVYQQAVEQLIQQRSPDVVLLGFTVNSMGFAPALAAQLGTGFASDVFAIEQAQDGLVVQRAFYGSKVQAEVEFPDHEKVSISISGSRARNQDFVDVATGDVDITTADFLLSIGRGVGEKDNVSQFEELADKMGATLSV